MGMLVAACPRCGAKDITFDFIAATPIEARSDSQMWVEAFCVCRACSVSTVFVLSQKDFTDGGYMSRLASLDYAANRHVNVETHISLKDAASEPPPEYLPDNIEAVFREGATCLAVDCFNAAGTMFRLCIDLATRLMLPEGGADGLNSKTKRDLGLRLPWLFANDKLPKDLEELSSCIREDGNDGAHQGTLGKEEAEDILDFTGVMLGRLYTQPKRVEIATERKDARRKPQDAS